MRARTIREGFIQLLVRAVSIERLLVDVLPPADRQVSQSLTIQLIQQLLGFLARSGLGVLLENIGQPLADFRLHL